MPAPAVGPEVHISFGTMAEIFAGAVAICGAIVVILNRFGLIKFGKKEKRECPMGGICPDPECQQDVSKIKDRVTTVKEDVRVLDVKVGTLDGKVARVRDDISKTIFPKINSTASDVQYIRGRIDEALKKP